MNLEELRQRIIDRYDITELIDTLGVTIDDIVDNLWDLVKDNTDILKEVTMMEDTNDST